MNNKGVNATTFYESGIPVRTVISGYFPRMGGLFVNREHQSHNVIWNLVQDRHGNMVPEINFMQLFRQLQSYGTYTIRRYKNNAYIVFSWVGEEGDVRVKQMGKMDSDLVDELIEKHLTEFLDRVEKAMWTNMRDYDDFARNVYDILDI